MELNIGVNGMLISSTGKDLYIIQIKTSMRVNFLMGILMVMGHISTHLEINMKENGKMEK